MTIFETDYLPVILAGGRGSRMTDLTSTIPKCLLPVANIPMIVYPLAMVQNAGFKEALILTSAKCSTDVRRVLVQHHISLKLDFVDIPDDEDLGTAEALKLAMHKITKNIVIISCDFVCDFSLAKFLDWHQANNHRLSILLSKTCVQGNAPGPKVKRKTERDLIALEPDDSANRIAFMSGETDFEDDFLTMHKNLILKFPRLNFTTKLSDCHVYVVDRILVDLINIIPNEFVSLKTDLIPFIIRLQHFKYSSIPPLIQALLKKFSELRGEDSFEIKCAARVMNNDEFSICARLNSIGAYFEANKQVLKCFPKLFPDPIFAPFVQCPQSNTKAQIGADSFVGQGTLCAVAGKKTQIKRTIIGRQCAIGENCKLNNCVIMDHVRIADGSTLVNCLVCHSCEIAEKCDLKDCLLATNQRVNAGEKLSAEVIGGSEAGKLMEI